MFLDLYTKMFIKKTFPVWIRNRLVSAGLELVISFTKKLYIAWYYRQFSTNIQIKIIKLIPVLLAKGQITILLDKTFLTELT